jgi:hypothetical protein
MAEEKRIGYQVVGKILAALGRLTGCPCPCVQNLSP